VSSGPVSGRRYAFLPFLYDEAAARVRLANNAHLGDGVGAYRASAAAAGSLESASDLAGVRAPGPA
jgi:hypothetical protein